MSDSERRHDGDWMAMRVRQAVSRRRLLAGTGAAVAAAAFLAACGSDGEEAAATASSTATATGTATEAPSASPTATPTAAASAWPRTIEHYMGTTTLEAQPERIVAASDLFELDNLLAMGVRPILYGYSNRYGTGVTPWAEAAGEAGIEQFEWTGEFDLERIAAASPDVIISEWYWGGEEGYELLEPIAPRVVLPKADTDETGWRLPQRVAGETCGTEEAAEAAIAETEAALAAQKERLAPYADRVVTIAYGLYTENWFADSSDGPSGRMLNDMGMTLAAVGPDDNAAISAEQLNLLNDADILISYDTGPESLAAWESHPLFQQIPAVQEGRYMVVSPTMLRAIFSPTTLSVRWAAEPLADAIIEAAEGRGKQVAAG